MEGSDEERSNNAGKFSCSMVEHGKQEETEMNNGRQVSLTT
jgi:hypothetical protein